MKNILSFFCGSLYGVTVDLVTFQTLSWLGLGAAWCNIASASLAVITTYVFVTRYTFKTAHSLNTFAVFAAWYALSIAFFSWAIGLSVAATAWPPFTCKVLSLPLSFTVNFLFSRFFLGRKKACLTA